MPTADKARKETESSTAEQTLTGVCRVQNVLKETLTSNNQPIGVCRVQFEEKEDEMKNSEEEENDDCDKELEEIFHELRANPTMAKAFIDGMSQEEKAMLADIEEHTISKTTERVFETPDIPCPSTPPRPPAGSLLSELQRPLSPTGICDFPFEDPIEIPNLKHQTNFSLPKFKMNKVKMDEIVQDVTEADEYMQQEYMPEARVAEVSTYTVIADVGTYARTFKVLKTEVMDKGALADSGANCSMTADIKRLSNVRKLPKPIVIGLAITSDGSITSTAECTHVGDITINCDNGETIVTECFYNPHASDTIISPQAIIDNSEEYTKWIQIGRKFGQPGQISFEGPQGSKTISLQQRDGLYFIESSTYEIRDDRDDMAYEPIPRCNRLSAYKVETTEANSQTILKGDPKKQAPRPKKYKPASKAKILEAETWYLRMGACNEQQLEQLTDHAIGIPKNFEWHPFRYVDFKEQARIRKQPAGRDPQKVAIRGRRFYMDFGFIRASNSDFSKKSNKTDRVVESFDGYSSYLLIVDEVSKYAWIFLTKSKEPPIELTKIFLKEFGNEDGGFIRCDQGGELARSAKWRSTMLEEFQYKVEPTGADSPSQNGQVERYNDTVGTIVRTLLYGANLPAKYWSVAAIHAVYLMNRRVHSKIGMTPYEAWWDETPDLSAMKVFGSRVCVRVTGKRNSKLDRHDFTGIFVGYTATDDNIKYIDVDSGLVKSSHHAVFDEAWYLQPTRPPMAQLLYDMGMETEEQFQQAPPAKPRQQAPWPPMPNEQQAVKIPEKAKLQHIPLRMTAQPQQRTENARAAHLTINRTNIIEDMQFDKEDVFAQIYLSPSPYFEAFEEEIDLRKWNLNDHHTAGLVLIQKDDTLILGNILKSTPAAKINKWRSRCRGAALLEVNGRPVHTQRDVEQILENLKERGRDTCKITLAHPEIKHGLTSKGIPQIHIDQLNTRAIMNLEVVIQKQEVSKKVSGGVQQYSFCKLTRGKLVKQPDWGDWQKSEWLQLDQYYNQGMFGDPVYVKDKSKVFNLVWTYTIKDLDKRKKARCACDGSTRGGKVRVFDYTHANCVEHTASRLFYGISSAENLLIFGADVSNAFSEAPPPKQGFYLQPDRAYQEWWAAKGKPPIPDGYAIPVCRAMQGHPEASRLWEKHIDKIVREIGFQPTRHEPCIYEGYIKGERCIFKRQVDDFALATQNVEIAHEFFDMLDDKLTIPMKRFGLITLFNGIDVLQSRYFIKMSAETYIEKISQRHLENWMTDIKEMANRPLPMPTTDTFKKSFEAAIGDPDEKEQMKLEREYKFKYRSGIGKIIYAMVTCQPDVSTAIVKCAQHSACPAKPHYNAVRHLLKYLYVTKNEGIYFWRAKPLLELPEHPLPSHCASQHGPIGPKAIRPSHGPLTPYTFVDSDWASCIKTRRSTTGMNVKLAGGTIYYKTKLQPTVAMSSTEAEYMAASDAGKVILYIRSIMWDLNIPQQAASILYEDNDGCTAMANAQKPTSRTRHMDIRYFALSDWVEQDLMILERIDTSVNEADHFTKVLDRTLFYRHIDHIMGHIPPPYSPCHSQAAFSGQAASINEDVSRDTLVVKPPVARAAKCDLVLDMWVHVVAHQMVPVQSNPVILPHWIVGGC